jgi:hypothetical protein
VRHCRPNRGSRAKGASPGAQAGECGDG